MLSTKQFISLGLFVEENFLDRELLELILSEIQDTNAEQALVVSPKRKGILLDETIRKTEELQVSSATKSLIKKRLFALSSRIENHFDVELNGNQNLLFYRYRKGGFFNHHQDSSNHPDAPKFLQERRISLIIFLNEMSDSPLPNSYSGGSLTFYGLMKDPRWQSYGFPFAGKPGMLVAFPSNLWHEVKPVTYGERYTIVTWMI